MKVIFTHLKPDIWQYKVASALKKRGVEIISISLLDNKRFDKAFNKVVSLKLENLKPRTVLKKLMKSTLIFIKFFYNLLTIKADAVICQGAPHYLVAFFIWFFKGKMPRIYFPYDMNFSRMKNPEKYIPKREIWGEKYSFQKCDAIIVKTTEKELDFLPESFKAKAKPVLVFQCYTFPEWFSPYDKKNKLSSKDKEIHIVYTGSLTDKSFHYNKSMLPDFTKILKQKMHLHLYCAYDPINEGQISRVTENKEKLKKYFHVHEFVSPDKLSKESSKYDFGYFFGQYSKEAKPGSMKYTSATNKLASYLEACLPVIVYDGNWLTSQIIKKNKIGLSLKSVNNLKKIIKQTNHLALIRNVEKFRKEYSVDSHIEELIRFIKRIRLQYTKI